MIHVVLDMVIFEPSTKFQPFFGLLGNMNFTFGFYFKDVFLIFFFCRLDLFRLGFDSLI
jgi:hypothetical protein